MAAAITSRRFEEPRDNGSTKSRIQRFETGMVESLYAGDISLKHQWEVLELSQWMTTARISRELSSVGNTTMTVLPFDPPSYEDTISDAPPEYAAVSDSWSIGDEQLLSEPPIYAICPSDQKCRGFDSPMQALPPIDFSSRDTFRTHAGKKAKQAAKKAQHDKWADDAPAEDGNNNGGDGEDNGGAGGAGGGDNGGDGGAGDGGDDWDDGNKKKGKKGKKGKTAWEELEEEEEKKKKEEEEADAALADNGKPDAAGDANGVDEWSGFGQPTGKKGKKNKKKNAWEEPEEEEKPAAPPITVPGGFVDPPGDANQDDEWATTGNAKKGKKGKKGNRTADPVPPPPPPAPLAGTKDLNFDDVNLDDTSPKLDLDFGPADTKSSGFAGVGGWGGGWGSGSKWDFSGAGDLGDVAMDAKTAQKNSVENNNPWDAGGKKKDSKKTNTFDFDFDDLDNEVPAKNAVVGDKADEAWGGFTTTANKKDKKNAKKGVPAVEPAVVVVPEPEPEENFFNWGVTGQDKKKGKKDEPLPPPPPATVGTAKKGKKGKKDLQEEAAKVEDPIVPVADEPDPTMDGDLNEAHGGMWDGFDTVGSKDKKKNNEKKGTKTEPAKVGGTSAVVGVPPPPKAATTTSKDGFTSFWGTGKKDQKQNVGTFNSFPNDYDDPVGSLGDEGAFGTTAASPDWMHWGQPKETKKKGTKAIEEHITALPPPPPPAPEALVNESKWGVSSFWGASTNKDKDKKTKKGTESAAQAFDTKTMVPDATVEPAAEGEEDFSGWGVGKNAKKKKDNKKNDPIDVLGKTPAMSMVQSDAVTDLKSTVEEDSWGMWGKKDKKAKRGSIMADPPPPAPTPPDQGLSPPSSTLIDMADAPVDDGWGVFGSAKNKKKDEKKDAHKGVLSRESSSSKVPKVGDAKASKDAKPRKDSILGVPEEPDTAAFTMVEAKPKEEPAAKAAKSFWGGITGGYTSAKPKSAKELLKEKKEKEEKEKKEKEEADRARKEEEAEMAKAFAFEESEEAIDIVEEVPAKKPTKKAGTTGLNKVLSRDSKESKKSGNRVKDDAGVEDDPIVALIDEEPLPPSEPAAKKEEKKSAGWGVFGGSVKAGKKTPVETKKEIAMGNVANQGASLAGFPGRPDLAVDELQLATQTSPTLTKASLSKPKATANIVAKGSIADRIKALQHNVKDKVEVISPPPPPPLATLPAAPAAEDSLEFELTAEARRPFANNRKSISKPATAAGASSTKKKGKELESEDLAFPSYQSQLSPTMAGAFPNDEGADFFDVASGSPPNNAFGKDAKEKKDTKKNNKTAKKDAKPAKADLAVEGPLPSPPPPVAKKEKASVSKESKLPTPPPEEEPKPAKKERPRVVRDQGGSSSWGFWGAAPKAEAKKDRTSKDDAGTLPAKAKAPAPGLTRSKSARKASDRDVEKSSRSSGSDKAAKPDPRPTSSRGMSFSSMFGKASPPARSKSNRHSTSAAKSGTRRHSISVDAGMLSPPPDDEPVKIASKAAKVMGIGLQKPGLSRSQSTKDKGKQPAAPDPYAIDDDVSMVDDPDDDFVDFAEKPGPSPPRNPKTAKASKPTLKRASRTIDPILSGGEDGILVDAPMDGAEAVTSPEHIAFETPRRPAMKRSNTSAKKTPGLMGLFGSFRQKERRLSDGADRRRRPTVYGSDDGAGNRKRAPAGIGGEGSKRIRHDGRQVNRSRRSDEDGEPMTDASPVSDPEDADARGRGGKASRAEQAAKAEDRAARAREQERAAHEARKAKRAKEDEEHDRRRRAEKQAKRERVERAEREEEARRERRARRREAELANGPTSPRPRTGDRRRSHMDKPPRTADDRPRYSRRGTGERSTHHHNSAPPVEDYFDRRNGSHRVDATPSASKQPYLSNGGDKTSSWVNRVNMEPPLPPPIETSVVDAAPDMRNGYSQNAAQREDQGGRREKRQGTRHSRHDSQPNAYDAEQRKGRKASRRETYDGVRSSEGSGEEYGRGGGRGGRRKSNYAAKGGGGMEYADAYVAPAPVRAFDERPSGGGRRGSWLKKIAGF